MSTRITPRAATVLALLLLAAPSAGAVPASDFNPYHHAVVAPTDRPVDLTRLLTGPTADLSLDPSDGPRVVPRGLCRWF